MLRHSFRVRGLTCTLAALVALVGGGCGSDATVQTPAGTDDVDSGINTPEITTTPDVPVVPDTGPDIVAPEDLGPPDVKVTELPPVDIDQSACPGGEKCACTDGTKCDNGKCIDTPDGKRCAQKCESSGCGAGYSCKLLGDGVDATTFCVPNYLTTCAPCKFNKDCQVAGASNDALCLSYGDNGKYCGGVCKADADCPSDKYACTDVTDEGTGAKSKQCKLKPSVTPGSGTDCSKDATVCLKGESCNAGKCAFVAQGQCECSAWAKGAGTETECAITNAEGSCKSARKCSPDGLEKCAAKTPSAEICNANDDNCDGKIDNLAADFKCFKEAWKDGGSGATCKVTSDCVAPNESCDPTSGTCKPSVGKCYGKPSCANNGELICNEAKTPKPEVCNGDDDNCDGKVDEGFTWNDPSSGLEISVNQVCGAGACAGGIVLCKDQLTAVCSTASKIAKEGCDNIDNDCNGKVDDKSCDDANVCTEDVCDSVASKCSNPPNLLPCDDKNACTLVDNCDGKGGCVGAAKDCDDKDQCTTDTCDPLNGNCASKSYVGSCSDGNACTVGDACGAGADGKYTCLFGKDAPKCDDANLCTTDTCDTEKGCVNTNNAESQSCYDGDVKTKSVGLCKAGTKFCVDGKLDVVCKDQVLPNKAEACDGKDDNCNGATDEGCKATSVNVTFSSAYVSGKSGNMNVQVLVGPSGPVGKAAAGPGGNYSINFGFMAWLMSLVGK